jgi:hypothetical protein
MQRRQKLVDLYLYVVDACLRGGLSDWWRQAVSIPFDDLAQGAEQLKQLCLQDLLVDAGDVATFCRAYEILEAEGYLAGDERSLFLLELVRFVGPLLRSDRARPPSSRKWLLWRKQKPAAILSIVVPDDRSLDNLFDLCLPTLESGSGMKWFTGQRTVTLLLAVSAKRIGEVEARLKARGMAWTISCRPLPETLCDGSVLDDVRREWLVGAMQHQHLTEAASFGAEFYSINPNGIYAAGYLNELLKVSDGRPAVLSAILWVNNRGALDGVMADDGESGSRSVSALDLANLGCGASAVALCSTFVEGFGHIRGQTSHLRVSWLSRDGLDIYSTCHEILYLSAKTLHALPQRFSIRPGADVERILEGQADPHFIAASDGIVVGEVGHPPGAFGDIGGDPARFEAVTDPLTLKWPRKFFGQPVRLRVACHDGAAHLDADEQSVQALKEAFVEAIGGDRSAPTLPQLLTALNVIHQYEMSEYGRDNMAGAIAEGRRLTELYPMKGPHLDKADRAALVRATMNVDHPDRAIAFARKGGTETSFNHEFLSKMMELRAANTERARQMRHRFWPGRPYAVLGSIAWGEAFVDKFMNYHVPSLLAAGNIPALARRRRVVHSIVTTEADRKRIVSNPVFKHLSRHAEVIFTCFPEAFITQREQNQYPFYPFYGLLDHQSVFLAAALRAELYLLPIDIVIGCDSLANLGRHLDRGADICTVAGIECEPASLRTWLDGRPRGPGGELDLPPDDLMEAAISMPDAYARSLIMNADNRSFCRHPRELVWPHADGLSVHSIYMHPVAVSSRVTSRPFSPSYENVDYALLPRLLQADGKLEILEDAREMVIAQFGAPTAREEFRDGGFSIEAFMDAHRYDYAVHRRCFATRQRFACASPPFAPSDSHDTDVGLIRAALKRYKFTLTGEEGF